MSFTTLVSAEDLRTAPAGVVVLDCGFDLGDPAAGERAYAAGHLPGAIYAHLERDLSGPKGDGRRGRHPLPTREAFAATVGAWGIRPETQIVCCDAQGGPYAARAWWMLKWLGHEKVAVLDGGPAAWTAAGGELVIAATAPAAGAPYPLSPAPAMPTITAESLLAALGHVRLVDARAGERFRGEVEPIDPVGGHIPGATNRCFKDNLQADGRFKPASTLRAEFERWATPAEQVVLQCGSGVTACHNLLAMAHAGFEGMRLYPGSWSEWCRDPARPIARG
ncbi:MULTISPECIES: sulfurtransferase [unclassified Rubrivivax]|uniref:sulfurtransferase n=1 Tax=unclassified Rubrivivax TaxID=2649762 RepID=UPI001E4B56B1|nr:MULTISPECIES: sulfurtransferase [unclassified Rubrivivax]MCC9596159.1 sulfurtransferase [Rubrivivax sp. JA1055]MCC9647500.1 sulfurtransferase [Rubrivivax sp. JA1029]